MDVPTGMLAVIPSRLGVGELFDLKLKVLGPVHPVPSAGAWNTPKPGWRGPFNLNVERQIQYMDNALPRWRGRLLVDGGQGLDGPGQIAFDGEHQGVFTGDERPIARRGGFRWTTPGFHFLRLVEPHSGLEAWANPVWVTEEPPVERIVWGDPHWQTFFSDGIRCPEELYAFARDEGFLDFGAVSDHMEAVTDRQWEYFQAVTNDFDEPGRFVTLQGQEWTHHVGADGAPGHRNIYYRGAGGPPVRCTDANCNTLEKLWRKLDALPAGQVLAIPHHPANAVMGVKWEMGWNPRYERAVEIHSVWGTSERHADDGNPRPIAPENLGGEMRGRHVQDALKLGYRLGFVGGGDIHDGRPGDQLHNESYPPKSFRSHLEGFTAAYVPALTREHVFDAMAERRTYATTQCRIYLDTTRRSDGMDVRAAAEDGVEHVVLVRHGTDYAVARPAADTRIVEAHLKWDELGPEEFAYVRVTTGSGNVAWSSPVWGG